MAVASRATYRCGMRDRRLTSSPPPAHDSVVAIEHAAEAEVATHPIYPAGRPARRSRTRCTECSNCERPIRPARSAWRSAFPAFVAAPLVRVEEQVGAGARRGQAHLGGTAVVPRRDGLQGVADRDPAEAEPSAKLAGGDLLREGRRAVGEVGVDRGADHHHLPASRRSASGTDARRFAAAASARVEFAARRDRCPRRARRGRGSACRWRRPRGAVGPPRTGPRCRSRGPGSTRSCGAGRGSQLPRRPTSSTGARLTLTPTRFRLPPCSPPAAGCSGSPRCPSRCAEAFGGPGEPLHQAPLLVDHDQQRAAQAGRPLDPLQVVDEPPGVAAAAEVVVEQDHPGQAAPGRSCAVTPPRGAARPRSRRPAAGRRARRPRARRRRLRRAAVREHDPESGRDPADAERGGARRLQKVSFPGKPGNRTPDWPSGRES